MAFTNIDSVKKFRLGTVAKGPDGKEYVYLPGVASVAAGSWVSYDEAFATTLIDTDVAASLFGPVAVATAAVVASKYGWFQRKGSASAAALTVADNTRVHASATAGSADDTGVESTQIIGAVWRSADSAGFATVQLDKPWIGMDVD